MIAAWAILSVQYLLGGRKHSDFGVGIILLMSMTGLGCRDSLAIQTPSSSSSSFLMVRGGPIINKAAGLRVEEAKWPAILDLLQFVVLILIFFAKSSIICQYGVIVQLVKMSFDFKSIHLCWWDGLNQAAKNYSSLKWFSTHRQRDKLRKSRSTEAWNWSWGFENGELLGVNRDEALVKAEDNTLPRLHSFSDYWAK